MLTFNIDRPFYFGQAHYFEENRFILLLFKIIQLVHFLVFFILLVLCKAMLVFMFSSFSFFYSSLFLFIKLIPSFFLYLPRGKFIVLFDCWLQLLVPPSFLTITDCIAELTETGACSALKSFILGCNIKLGNDA